MRTLGLIGGMSWESTALYYKWINEKVRDATTPLTSASIILHSYNFADIKTMQFEGNWNAAAQSLAATALRLEAAGADAIVLCTNTMHKTADAIEAAISVPFLHLADCTAKEIVKAGHRHVALLGTRFTMEEDFYADRLRKFGLEVMVPDSGEIGMINAIIYDELCAGIVSGASKQKMVSAIHRLAGAGAQAVILGCTEITMLISPSDVAIPCFDTTAIHADAAARFALGQ